MNHDPLMPFGPMNGIPDTMMADDPFLAELNRQTRIIAEGISRSIINSVVNPMCIKPYERRQTKRGKRRHRHDLRNHFRKILNGIQKNVHVGMERAVLGLSETEWQPKTDPRAGLENMAWESTVEVHAEPIKDKAIRDFITVSFV